MRPTTPERMFKHIIRAQREEALKYTYIILGDRPATGKTWLCNELRAHGFNAFEISEHIFDLVEYTDQENHFFVDVVNNQVVIVLNRPLKRNV